MSNEPRLECFDCMSAASGVHHGYMANCHGCKARGASRLPHFARAMKTGMQDRHYREFLRQAGLTHEEVKAAHEADAMNAEQVET